MPTGGMQLIINIAMRKIWIIMAVCAIGTAATGCKAWRTISTTATYTQVSDSAKVATTISTKTVEEYQGVRKK